MANAELQKRIDELELMLRQKDEEIAGYRREILRAQSILDRMSVDLGQDLRIAQALQKLLSPTEIPTIPGFEFSTKFRPGHAAGGDYFDLFEHEDKLKFGLIVTASSGYAMSALFLSVLIQLSSKIEARRGLSPEKTLAQMLSQMQPQMSAKDQADVIYAVIDRRNYDLHYSSCGMQAVFHDPQGQSKWTRLEAGCGAFQKDFSQVPLLQTLQLGPRDRVLICTPGILKTPSANGQPWGLDGLQSLLQSSKAKSVHELRNEILYACDKHGGSDEPNRDQTVVVMEVKDRVIKLAKS